MSRAELESLVRRITFGPALAHWRPRFEILSEPVHGNVGILVEFEVRHRDTGKPGPVMVQQVISTDVPFAFILEQLFQLVRSFAEHEVHEGFRLDGKLLKDPHRETT